MICFELACIIQETFSETELISDYFPVSALEFRFNNFSFLVHLVHVKFAGSGIIII
jgi:hypothetical protein